MCEGANKITTWVSIWNGVRSEVLRVSLSYAVDKRRERDWPFVNLIFSYPKQTETQLLKGKSEREMENAEEMMQQNDEVLSVELPAPSGWNKLVSSPLLSSLFLLFFVLRFQLDDWGVKWKPLIFLFFFYGFCFLLVILLHV